MKVTVTKYLNARVGKPHLNAPNYQYLAPGSELEVDGQLYYGDPYNGIDTWYKDETGNYYWSGGVESPNDIDLDYNEKLTGEFDLIPFRCPDPKKLDEKKLPWSLLKFNISQWWKYSFGKGVKIAVLDTGIILDHPELKGKVEKGWNFIDNNSDITDDTGHGTHICGTLVSKGVKYYGICPEASLLIAKVESSTAKVTNERLNRAIKWAVAQGADIISISQGRYTKNEGLGICIKDSFENKNIIFICSAGNDGEALGNYDLYPASFNECISVGALNKSLKRAKFSSKSSLLNIMAPGVDILSCNYKGGYKQLSGTSFATPFVAGIAVLIISYYKHKKTPYSSDELVKLITSKTAKSSFEQYNKNEYGAGIIDTIKILQQITPL